MLFVIPGAAQSRYGIQGNGLNSSLIESLVQDQVRQVKRKDFLGRPK
jgi:hypothetical protein